jgi:alpha-L-rhamnosidase
VQRGCYDNNTVTSNLLPLYFGITPETSRQTVFNSIYNKINNDDKLHISTGVIGTQWLMRGLTDHGHADIAYSLASNKTYPGWGYMTEHGATTIWELWNGNTASPQMNSQNHVMLLGDLLIWLYEDMAGICSSKNSVAFKEITMKPCFEAGPKMVTASYQSVYGRISSYWKIEDASLKWEIIIPANAKALVYIPAHTAGDVREGDNKAEESTGVHFLRMEKEYAVFEVGSGKYEFSVHTMP